MPNMFFYKSIMIGLPNTAADLSENNKKILDILDKE